MSQHQDLASGRWNQLPFMTQLANTASEVERALKWREKGNSAYFQKAGERALELLDLTKADPKNRKRLREIARSREVLTDFFFGENEYMSTPESWRSYFSRFSFAARKDC